MYDSKLLSTSKLLLIPLMIFMMALSVIGFMITPAKAAETDSNSQANVNLRDQVTEDYIKEHADSKYTSVDKAKLRNLILVKQTLFDGSKIKDDDTLDIMYDIDRSSDALLGQFLFDIPVYSLSDNSPYYVAYINTMQNNQNATVKDVDVAINNNNGVVVDGCVYDYNTGLIYIPKSAYQEDGKEIYYNLQAQIMQVMNSSDDIKLNTQSEVQNENDHISNKKTQVFDDIYAENVTITTEKNIDPEHLAVYSNGNLLYPNQYKYDPESGVVTLIGSPVIHGNVTVNILNDKESEEIKSVNNTNSKGEEIQDFALATQTFDLDNMQYLRDKPIVLPADAKEGDSMIVHTRMQYFSNDYLTAHFNANMAPGVYEISIPNNSPHTGEDYVRERCRFSNWVDTNKAFDEEDYIVYPPEAGHNSWQFLGYFDGKDGGTATMERTQKKVSTEVIGHVILNCIHVGEAFDPQPVTDLNNGEVWDGEISPESEGQTPGDYGSIYRNFPFRLRIYKLTDDYVVLGVIGARASTHPASGSTEVTNQSIYGLLKLPVQKENLNLSIEKDNESGAKLAGADMQLHKDAISDTPYSTWKTVEENPKDFENIEAGKYIIVEKNAPEGYTKVDPIEFTLKDDNSIEITKDPSGKATVEMVDGVATIKVADPKELNPTGDKTETNPGDGQAVKHGQEITYEITTTNKYTRNADVVITDPLDKGLDFVTADNGGSYNESTRTITWSFDNVAPNETKKVTFKAKVNESAEIKVVNDAKIVYDNDYEINTKKVQNPIPEPPVKAEPTPGENKTVSVGGNVTYEVTQKNYKDAPTDIVFTDHLDSRVDFVTADNDGHYDANTHTITWTIKNVPSGQIAKVGFTVKVNEKAKTIIENQAIAKVGNDPEQETNIIKNPLDAPPVKTEPTPGENKTVKIGDEVKYEVSQRNYKFEAADIVITDHLDKGVDFISADNNGQYDNATHTITWTIKNVASDSTAKVGFTVKVNEKAQTLIENQAIAKVGNDPEKETNIIRNPVPEPPVKAEPTPGENKTVNVGDEVTYEVSQKNYKFEAADIVFTDHLDERVDFVSADNGGVYDENTHTITWTIPNVPAGETAKVGFVVKVNDKAVEIIENQAIAKVGDDPEQETNIIKNPLPEPPVKTEPKPGENEPVSVGDEVTYEVAQKNYKLENADIVITDHLDERVDFVSADNDGAYDKATHTITWTIKDVPAGETAKVGFVVKVNDKATEIIENKAIAKVGDDPEQETNIIKNPLKTPVVKTEITPGEGKQVKVGDEVTYKVHFMNYRLTPETVVVTDKLDPGVDFVSADNNGTYDKANHMIVWTFKDMEARKEQDVTFKVKVNSKAGTVIRNQAEVQVGNDPVQKTNIIENPLAPGSAKTGVEGNNNTLIFVIIGILCVAALGCGIYFFNKKQKENTVTESKTVKKDTNVKDKKDVK